MNGLVLCGTGPHCSILWLACCGCRPSMGPNTFTISNLQRRTIQHDAPWHTCPAKAVVPHTHTPTHTVHIPQHRHLHTNTYVTNITNGNTSLTVWGEKKKTASISISTLSRALLSVGTSMMVVSFACSPSVFWMWASGNWKWIPNHDADNKFHALTHPSMN